MKRVILTGGTGFVGANLTRRLLHEGHEVNLLARSDYTTWRIKDVAADVRIHIADLRSKEVVEAIVARIQPDWIFHLAVHGAYSWQTDVYDIHETNLLGTINLVEACLKVGFETLVNTGSSSEYGFKEHAPSEQEWLDPNSYYAVMKAAATMFCRFIARRDNVPIPTLRLYSVYGPYEEPQRLIPALVVNGLRGQLPPLVNPNVARDFVYVDDVCDAYLLAATQQKADSGAIYNVGSGIQTSLDKIVDIARQLFSIESTPEWGSMQSRDWDTTAWVANTDYIQQSLGWHPRTSLTDGLLQTADWLQTHPHLHRFYEQQLLS